MHQYYESVVIESKSSVVQSPSSLTRPMQMDVQRRQQLAGSKRPRSGSIQGPGAASALASQSEESSSSSDGDAAEGDKRKRRKHKHGKEKHGRKHKHSSGKASRKTREKRAKKERSAQDAAAPVSWPSLILQGFMEKCRS